MIIASERSSKNHRLPHLPQAESLSRMLSDEFGEPFAFHDAVSGERLWDSGAEDVSDEVRDAVLRCAIEHQPHVSVMDVNHYLLTIPFSNNHPSCVVGVGVLPALAHTHNERAVEQQRLQKWAASVMRRWNDRQQAASQKPAKPSNPPQQPTLVWNSLLAMDKLFRRLRIHKDPLKYRKRILDAVADLLNVQTLVWVSQDGEAPVIGGEPCLSPWDCQQLALHLAKSPHWDETGVMLGNDVTDESWSDRCPHVKNLLAITLCDHRAAGWAIAINKHAPVSGQDVRNLGMNRHTDNASPEMPATSPRATVPFRLSDAAVLTPLLVVVRAVPNGVSTVSEPQRTDGGISPGADRVHRRQGSIHVRSQRACGLRCRRVGQ